MREEQLWQYLETVEGKDKLLEIINSNIEEIERLKQDNEYLNKVNIELSAEKNRLNNIINELEKWLEDKNKNALQDDNYWEVLDKLQKLKENI